MPLMPPPPAPAPNIDFTQDGRTLIENAWEYHRAYWNTIAPLQTLNLAILQGAIDSIR